jgi:hypothetical protein
LRGLLQLNIGNARQLRKMVEQPDLERFITVNWN